MTSAVIEICKRHNLILPQRHMSHAYWRMTRRIPGQIQSLPTTQGVLIATNGILCLIEQEQRVFIGHIGWFIADDLDNRELVASECERDDVPAKRAAKSARLQKLQQIFN